MTKRTSSSTKKKIVKPVEPIVRDFVRTCSCGNRILVSTRKHGYLTSLTVEINGYLSDLKYSGLEKLKLPFDVSPNLNYAKELRKRGIVKSYNKIQIQQFKKKLGYIPKRVIRTFDPKGIVTLICEGCDGRLYLKLFQEIKHVA